jgi:hypothetical protein
MPPLLTRAALLAVLLFTFSPSQATPHGGGLDAYGCHHDRKRGGYHCHRGQFAGQAFGSQQEMLQALDRPAPLTSPRQERTTVLAPQPSTLGKERVCVREEKTKQIMCGELVQ